MDSIKAENIQKTCLNENIIFRWSRSCEQISEEVGSCWQEVIIDERPPVPDKEDTIAVRSASAFRCTGVTVAPGPHQIFLWTSHGHLLRVHVQTRADFDNLRAFSRCFLSCDPFFAGCTEVRTIWYRGLPNVLVTISSCK